MEIDTFLQYNIVALFLPNYLLYYIKDKAIWYSPTEGESKVKQLLRDFTMEPGGGPSGQSILSSIAFEALLLNCSKKLSICVSMLVGELAIVTTETPKTNTTLSSDYDILQINLIFSVR